MKKKLISNALALTLIATSYFPVFADNQIPKITKEQEKLAIQAEERAKEDKQKLDLNIYIDGKKLTFTKEENLGMPFIDKNGRTLVPLRKPVEMTGASITWDNNTKTAKIVAKPKRLNMNEALKGQKDIQTKIIYVTVGKKYIMWHYENEPKTLEKMKEMDTEAVIKDGRVYIPFRAVMESIGLKVEYDKQTKTIKATNYQDGKVWNKEDIEKEFPQLIKSLKEFYPNVKSYVKIDTLILDNSLQDKMKIVTGKPNSTKWITLNTNGVGSMDFVKDNKVVFSTDNFLDNIFYFYFDLDEDRTNPYVSYQEDISTVDYMLIWRYDNPVAILVENPFKKGE